MIDDAQIPEMESYRRFEAEIPFRADNSLASLVVATDNDSVPLYRWYKFKEGFSYQLLTKICAKYVSTPTQTLTLLDPFCGSGTSLLSAQQLENEGIHISATGIERNPFIAFVARTKSSWSKISPEKLLSLGKKILEQKHTGAEIPELSSIKKETCISRYMASRIIGCRDAIRAHRRDATTNAALLALAASIEPVSKIRKDGRALRITGSKHTQFEKVYKERLQWIADDVRLAKMKLDKPASASVILGDGRDPISCGITENSVDLILTSPPYPNNIDYTEVYKLELWLMGFVQDADSFYKLRHTTVRSHPIITRPDADFSTLQNGKLQTILIPLLTRLKKDEPWRGAVFQAYFEDMAKSLRNHYKCLRPGGILALVIGNSLHGGSTNPILVATDLVLAELARQARFEVVEVTAARALRRRLAGNHFLRESILILKKPATPFSHTAVPKKISSEPQNHHGQHGNRDRN